MKLIEARALEIAVLITGVIVSAIIKQASPFYWSLLVVVLV